MNALAAPWRWWTRFFFEPVSPTPAALTRIAVGIVVLVEAASWAPDLTTWFAAGGLSPYGDRGGHGRTVFAVTASPNAVRLAFAALVVAALCMTAGLATRLSTVATYVLMLSFQNRMPYVMNSGDVMLHLLVLLLCLAPAGATLSADAWLRRRHDFWAAPPRPAWGLRLLQLQVVTIYFATVVEKLRSVTWPRGTALYYAFQSPDLVRVPLPGALLHQRLVVNAMTYGLLATEMALVVLIWPRRTRPFVLAVGVVMHVLGHVFLVLSIFTYVVLAAYVAFLPPDVAERLVLRVRPRPATLPQAAEAPA